MADAATALYGIDVQALDDLPDPEVLCSGVTNRAYALARHLVTPLGALAEIGDEAPYISFDVREYFGQRFRLTDRSVLDEIQSRAAAALRSDPFVSVATAQANYVNGTIVLSCQAEDDDGTPSNFILSVDGITATLLRGG